MAAATPSTGSPTTTSELLRVTPLSTWTSPPPPLAAVRITPVGRPLAFYCAPLVRRGAHV